MYNLDSTKKYSLIYMLSFITDIFAFFALDYVTARVWADFLALLFFAACVYQLAYIIRLHRQDGVSCGRAIARFFLYTCCAAECIALIWYGRYFFGGYTPTDWFGSAPVRPFTASARYSRTSGIMFSSCRC